jgi:hypothetical protein
MRSSANVTGKGKGGFSEISMAFIFHPVASFLLPLAVTCLFCPSLRRLFPDLAWFAGTSKGARFVLSAFVGTPVLFVPIVLNFVIWTLLGFLLTAVALVKGS